MMMTKTRKMISLSMKKRWRFGALVHPVAYDDPIACFALALKATSFDVDDPCYLESEVIVTRRMMRTLTMSVNVDG